jgi:SPBc2 prophage-derived putative antirepressor protein yoqD|nr:MAG TPA: regulatory protein [Siphoviridae sp. ctkTz2]
MNFKLKRLVLDSREVAKMLGKNHADLLRDIARNIEYLIESKIAFNEFFQEIQYKDKINRKNKRYDISKKGCEFLAHKLTGKKGAIFTATYINKFHEMEQALKEQKKLPFPEIRSTTWRGVPVIEVQDLSKLTNITDATIHWFSRNEKINLRSGNLQEYKRENSDKDYTNISAISVLYKEIVISLCKRYGVYEKYKDFIENYFRTDNRIECKVIDKPFNDKYYNEMYECMVKAYQFESQIEKIYEEQLLPLYNRIDKLNDLKRDTMLTPFYGMKYGNIFGKNKK